MRRLTASLLTFLAIACAPARAAEPPPPTDRLQIVRRLTDDHARLTGTLPSFFGRAVGPNTQRAAGRYVGELFEQPQFVAATRTWLAARDDRAVFRDWTTHYARSLAIGLRHVSDDDIAFVFSTQERLGLLKESLCLDPKIAAGPAIDVPQTDADCLYRILTKAMLASMGTRSAPPAPTQQQLAGMMQEGLKHLTPDEVDEIMNVAEAMGRGEQVPTPRICRTEALHDKAMGRTLPSTQRLWRRHQVIASFQALVDQREADAARSR
jgi:hypothetical protein